jgi:hypothetical protein
VRTICLACHKIDEANIINIKEVDVLKRSHGSVAQKNDCRLVQVCM